MNTLTVCRADIYRDHSQGVWFIHDCPLTVTGGAFWQQHTWQIRFTEHTPFDPLRMRKESTHRYPSGVDRDECEAWLSRHGLAPTPLQLFSAEVSAADYDFASRTRALDALAQAMQTEAPPWKG